MSEEKLTDVLIYLQSHRDPLQSRYRAIARLEMGLLPAKGDIIDISDYVFKEAIPYVGQNSVLRIEGLFVAYINKNGIKKEVVSVCGLLLPRLINVS